MNRNFFLSLRQPLMGSKQLAIESDCEWPYREHQEKRPGMGPEIKQFLIITYCIFVEAWP